MLRREASCPPGQPGDLHREPSRGTSPRWARGRPVPATSTSSILDGDQLAHRECRSPMPTWIAAQRVALLRWKPHRTASASPAQRNVARSRGAAPALTAPYLRPSAARCTLANDTHYVMRTKRTGDGQRVPRWPARRPGTSGIRFDLVKLRHGPLSRSLWTGDYLG